MESNRVPEQSVERKPYHSPELVEYGELRNLTLGGSGGTGDIEGSFPV